MKYGDAEQKKIYKAEAKAIDAIQKDILSIAKNEKPFDVFICYKETDEAGKRTQDSVIANDIYHQLTQEGFKVFYAAITLEDKLGQEYEPYIFAALNSAKVMLVIGSKPEYFTAVWVKNEWSRFLKIMKSDRSKLLIPCYKDMDAYELPDDFAHLQAQDMSKLGFMQDLIRGIKKIVGTVEPVVVEQRKETVVVNNANTAPLLERVFIFLEDGRWQDADIYCEKVLDIDPKNAEAYLGKLMAELNVTNRKKLADLKEPFDNKDNCQKAIRFGDEELKKFLDNCNKEIVYNNAQSSMRNAQSEDEYKKAASIFNSINGFKDADTLAEQCLDKAEICRKDELYNSAVMKMKFDLMVSYKDAIKTFQTISGWKDADEQVYACQRKIEEIKAKEEADRLEAERKAEEKRIAAEKAKAKTKKLAMIISPIVAVVVVFFIVLNTVIIPTSNRKSAYEKYGTVLSNANVGDIISFGAYEQDNNTSNGKEDIEWRVLAKEDNRILVISEYALDCQQYNTSCTDVTWENCSLRNWMNGIFLNNAFSEEERSIIPSTNVSADKNPDYSTNPGNATTDKVFLLSITEVKKYFASDSARQCKPTKYAVANGAYVDSDNGTCLWWLRSPGYYQDYAANVISGGSVRYYGNDVDRGSGCVRPALWIEI